MDTWTHNLCKSNWLNILQSIDILQIRVVARAVATTEDTGVC